MDCGLQPFYQFRLRHTPHQQACGINYIPEVSIKHGFLACALGHLLSGSWEPLLCQKISEVGHLEGIQICARRLCHLPFFLPLPPLFSLVLPPLPLLLELQKDRPDNELS